MKEKLPVVLFNNIDQNKIEIETILKSHIKCNFFENISDIKEFTLYYNSMTFYGLDGVKSFIR